MYSVEGGSCLSDLLSYRDADFTIADATGANQLCEYDREILLQPSAKELSVAKQCQWQPSRFEVRSSVFFVCVRAHSHALKKQTSSPTHTPPPTHPPTKKYK